MKRNTDFELSHFPHAMGEWAWVGRVNYPFQMFKNVHQMNNYVARVVYMNEHNY